MALAIIRFLMVEKGQVKFTIDTGTNPFYYLKIGSSETERNGFNWVDPVTMKTPLQKNENSPTIFNSSKDISVDAALFTDKNCYVQLFSFKDKEGTSPAFSDVLKVPVGSMHLRDVPELSFSTSINQSTMTKTSFNLHRTIPHPPATSAYAKQASLESILADVVKVAGPIVMGLLAGTQNNPAAGAATTTATPAQGVPQLGMLNTILDVLLKGLGNAVPITSEAKSVSPLIPAKGNSFIKQDYPRFSNQFIFGIDDAIIASLAGPVLQMLPQLANIAGQQKLQNKQANNKLVTDLLAETNRRMMLQQFLQNQQASGSTPTGSGIDMNQLLQLLQQLPAAAPVAAVTPAVAESLSNGKYIVTLSTKTILSFEAAPAIIFNGKEQRAYAKSADIKLKIKFNVVEPAPQTPLPKAIINFIFKDAKGTKLFEKQFKKRNIIPNSIAEYTFTSLELSAIPVNTTIQVFSEMKWLTAQNREVKTLGNTEIILTENYFLKAQGKEVNEERELTDMKVYRSFWNKIWESPVLDAINSGKDETKKYRWELNANLKYCFYISADHTSNGLMETKKLIAQKDPDSMSEKTEGRMKAGVELSLSELNKLNSLWDNQPLLSPEQLAAFKSIGFATNNNSEFIYSLKLKGKANERGMVWVVPVFRLVNFSLGKIKNTNDCGQVTETGDEQVQLPLPVSARILGLKTA